MRASVPPNSVVVIESSKYLITTRINCVKITCDATDFEDGMLDFLGSHCYLFIFQFKKYFFSLYVKRSGNKTVIYLSRLCVCQPGCIISLGVYPIELNHFNEMHNILQKK